MKCENCRWWIKGNRCDKTTGMREGACRRFPPQIMMGLFNFYHKWPITLEDNGCGEFKEKEK